jgi:hypothetical protein
VGIFVVMMLVVRKNDSSVFECYLVCHLIHSVYSYSVATVHVARSLKRSTLKLKCTYLFNLCSSVLFIIVTQLIVCTPITFVTYQVAWSCIYRPHTAIARVELQPSALCWVRTEILVQFNLQLSTN